MYTRQYLKRGFTYINTWLYELWKTFLDLSKRYIAFQVWDTNVMIRGSALPIWMSEIIGVLRDRVFKGGLYFSPVQECFSSETKIKLFCIWT